MAERAAIEPKQRIMLGQAPAVVCWLYEDTEYADCFVVYLDEHRRACWPRSRDRPLSLYEPLEQ